MLNGLDTTLLAPDFFGLVRMDTTASRRHAPRTLRRVIAACFLLLVVISCDQKSATAPDSTSLANPVDRSRLEIAFSHSVPESLREPDLYLMSADGKETQLLVSLPGSEFAPDWSPDGRSLVFTRLMSDGKTSLWIIDVDGTHVRPLATDLDQTRSAKWSPDGIWIAFEGPPVSPLNNGIALIHPDGTGFHWFPSPDLSLRSAAWSPDGRRIAFAGQGGSIWAIGVDGSNPVRVTRGSADRLFADRSPSWSPDGTRLAYIKQLSLGRGSYPSVVTVVNVDGSAEQQLTQDSQADFPTWSADGQWIAFEDSRFSPALGVFHPSVFKVAAAGGEPIDLMPANTSPVGPSPAWRHTVGSAR